LNETYRLQTIEDLCARREAACSKNYFDHLLSYPTVRCAFCTTCCGFVCRIVDRQLKKLWSSDHLCSDVGTESDAEHTGGSSGTCIIVGRRWWATTIKGEEQSTVGLVGYVCAVAIFDDNLASNSLDVFVTSFVNTKLRDWLGRTYLGSDLFLCWLGRKTLTQFC